jgi:TetR/AcrR family transcriptional regulator, regulator of biofilm formation and stress response
MSGRRQRRTRGSAREAILRATLEVIAEEGIDAITHRRVAEVADVSPGSTTHHFSSRQDLIRGAFRFYLEQAGRALQAIDDEVRASVHDPWDRVTEFLSEVVRREFTNERLVRAEYEMVLYASTDEELAAHLRGWEARVIAGLAGDLEAAGAPFAVETARALVDLLRGYELERLINPGLGVDVFRRRLESVVALRRELRSRELPGDVERAEHGRTRGSRDRDPA